jgi:hypothetical protein
LHHLVLVATALQRETRAIPIVFVGAIDPVGAGLVASLARPGGNLTGTLLNEEGIVGKWLAMLKRDDAEAEENRLSLRQRQHIGPFSRPAIGEQSRFMSTRPNLPSNTGSSFQL